MKILFIAPLPPPVTGQSLAVKIFKDFIEKSNQVEVVNLVKDTFKNGANSFVRIVEVLTILREVRKKKRNADKIYFTISESIAGNLKDILIYVICFNKLSKMTIHLHGGAGMKILMEKGNWLTKLNKFFLKRLGKIVILGKSHLDIYNFIDPKRISIVPNFAEDYIFINEDKVVKKFETGNALNILFLSNLIPGKGYLELLSAFKQMDETSKQNIKINFAGGFESEENKIAFLNEIQGISQLCYNGIVHGEQKKQLFHEAHVFCLPTYYAYEGQPISILEAYASGCVVITTNHSGIKDIFSQGVNGYEVKKKSVVSLRAALEQIIKAPQNLKEIGIYNRKISNERYRTDIYNKTLEKALNID